MRPLFNVTSAVLAAVLAVTLAPRLGEAQGQSQQVPLPPGGFKPPPMPAVKPYKAVAVTPPAPYDDAAFAAFRKQLAEVVQKKDRAALAKLIVPQGFFWMQDKDLADKRKTPIANLANAIDLDAKDGSGWDVLAGYAADPTANPLPDRQGVSARRRSRRSMQRPSRRWSRRRKPNRRTGPTPSRRHRSPRCGAAECAGRRKARPDAGARAAGQRAVERSRPALVPACRHAERKAGFVPTEAVAGIGGDAMCYTKDASGWKIIGYFGGASQ